MSMVRSQKSIGRVDRSFSRERTLQDRRSHWRELKQLWKFGGRQPGEAIAMALWAGPWTIAHPTKGQAAMALWAGPWTIAIKTVPTQRNFLRGLTGHGLDGIPEERLYLTNFDCHVRLVTRSLERWALPTLPAL
jgi:hypothetical protein